MKRSPMKHGKARSWNSTLRPRSKKRQDYLDASDYAERSSEARGKPCAVNSPVCTKMAQGLHHILSRAAAGGLEAAERLGPKPVASCNSCNEYVERKGRQWALAHGWKETLKGRAA
jgi:hypothetical protein